jgi:predicted ATP-dependent endonuclease of OLD family
MLEPTIRSSLRENPSPLRTSLPEINKFNTTHVKASSKIDTQKASHPLRVSSKSHSIYTQKMLLKTVFVRFYKSFNDDFHRRLDPRAKELPWEKIEENWYPYIRVPIDRRITTVVGANESGKSHLLSAIRKAVSGENIERDDFCRYSKFFTVKKGQLKYPDFGTEWEELDNKEKDFFRKAFELPPSQIIDSIIIFRNNKNSLTAYLKNEFQEYVEYEVNGDYLDVIPDILPKVFTIDSDIALPDSVPIRKLLDQNLDNKNYGLIELLNYKQKAELSQLLDQLAKFPKTTRETPQKRNEAHDKLVEKIADALNKPTDSSTSKDKQAEETELAKKLIYNIAEIDPEVLSRLAEALKDGKQGYANGLIKMINEQLAHRLNFPSWWVQDKNFQLKLMARDHELVFTITDRTGTEYSFKERSSGLKYFLSYYIQYRSHVPVKGRNEILLMDEPDTYLSSRAQQDLLRIFEAFAEPSEDSHLSSPIQVVYVTHSPFLIDKNYSERIRVLKKGNDDEGTLVVRSVARNHYEPLRSAFGAFVGETTFIGNCNLMCEGSSDQILLAGAANLLTRVNTSKIECLDLNNTTIVPAGSASHIPYLVYLAVGRDKEKPVVIVLFDSDQAGDREKKNLLGQGKQYRKPLLKDDYVVQVGDIDEASFLKHDYDEKEIEDLIPISICIEATKSYLKEIGMDIDQGVLGQDAINPIENSLKDSDVYRAIESYIFSKCSSEIKIDKVGFCRNVLKVLSNHQKGTGTTLVKKDDFDVFIGNFRKLFYKLNKAMHKAHQRHGKSELSEKISRVKQRFLHKHPAIAKREEAILLVQDIEHILDDNYDRDSSFEIDKIRDVLKNLISTYKLDIKYDVAKHIDDYQGFLIGLEQVKYAGDMASQEDETVYGGTTPIHLTDSSPSDLVAESSSIGSEDKSTHVKSSRRSQQKPRS